MRKGHGLNTQMWNLIKQTCEEGTVCHQKFSQSFGYLFKRGDDQKFTEKQLNDLSLQMKGEENEPDSDVPIGLAFFGQFIDHDITFDTVSQLGKAADNFDKIKNLRTPKLDLDSVYLNGPEGSPYLYKDDRSGKLILGTAKNRLDLQRNIEGTAIIGDPRNDENLFINQLHGLFIRFHNWLIDQGKSFEQAREFVRFTYQKAIVEEFLPALVEAGILQAYINGFNRAKKLPRPINWLEQANMPIEFSAAAYRFGHSIIRENYQVKDNQAGKLFDFGGFKTLPENTYVDWKYFFDLDGDSYLKCKPINTKLAKSLFSLPFTNGGIKNLAFRNLDRGQRTFGLLTGEEIAKKLNGKPITKHPAIVELGLDETPLWFYILAEAEQHNGKLGLVGGSIVAGVLLQLLLADKESYIHQNPTFNPFDMLTNRKSILAAIAKICI